MPKVVLQPGGPGRNDGSRGALAIKAAGGYVIAQDEATSMIFGMPQEAIRTGAVNEVLPLDAIPNAVERRIMALGRLSKVGAL